MAHDSGIFTEDDGTLYEGQWKWKKDERNGRGTMKKVMAVYTRDNGKTASSTARKLTNVFPVKCLREWGNNLMNSNGTYY